VADLGCSASRGSIVQAAERLDLHEDARVASASFFAESST